MAALAALTKLPTPERTAFFLCDLQTRFRQLIHGFDSVAFTAGKMMKMAKVMNVRVVITEQNPKALGPTIPELDLSALGELLYKPPFAKLTFSMLSEEVIASDALKDIDSVVLFGIESHVCVLQTALDLVQQGKSVHVLADGISSCNKEEIPIAVARMRAAGVNVTTSESIGFQLMGDASKPNFKAFSTIIKESKEGTATALKVLTPPPVLSGP